MLIECLLGEESLMKSSIKHKWNGRNSIIKILLDHEEERQVLMQVGEGLWEVLKYL